MRIVNEILDIVQGDDYEKPVKPEYINLVREKKQTGASGESEEVSKEQLLATVQVCVFHMYFMCISYVFHIAGG